MGSKQEYFNSNRLIPFTTHDDFMKLDKKYIESLAFITYLSSSTDFETISELGGFPAVEAASVQFSQLRLSATPWTAACQASVFIANSRSLWPPR